MAVKMRPAIDMYMWQDPDYRNLRITSSQREHLTWHVEQLLPFKKVIMMLESHWKMISQFIPMMNKLMEGLEDTSEGMGRAYVLRRMACRLAREKLTKYYSATVTNKWYTITISKFP